MRVCHQGRGGGGGLWWGGVVRSAGGEVIMDMGVAYEGVDPWPRL